jgi:hypothetical protein
MCPADQRADGLPPLIAGGPHEDRARRTQPPRLVHDRVGRQAPRPCGRYGQSPARSSTPRTCVRQHDLAITAERAQYQAELPRRRHQRRDHSRARPRRRRPWVRMTVLDAECRPVRLDAQDGELFWARRGEGGLGIVTELNSAWSSCPRYSAAACTSTVRTRNRFCVPTGNGWKDWTSARAPRSP